MTRPRAIVPVTTVEDDYIRMMVYGDSGVGKTVFASTSPRCLILNCDPAGTTSAAVRGSEAQRWNILDWNDMTEAYEYLRHEGHKEFDWVWVDSLTLFQERGLDNIMQDLVADKPHRKVYLPDKGEYGQNMNRVLILMRNMVALPMNLGVTAHVLRTEDEDGKVTFMPAIQGKNMPDKICAYMGIVGYMYARRTKEQTEIGLRTRKDAKHYAKDRFDAFPSGRLLSPTVPLLTAAVEKKLPKKQAAATTGRSPRRAGTVTRKAAQPKTTTRKVT
jgi:hypothetical protein